MSKLTFRADEDLIDRVEALEASKSEVMRAALRQYLDAVDSGADGPWSRRPSSLDALVAERVDRLVEARLGGPAPGAGRDPTIQDRVGSEGLPHRGSPASAGSSEPRAGSATPRLICACGDDLRAAWAFCPGCGRRTPAAELADL